MSWPVSSSCSHLSSTSGRWEKSQVCRVLNGLYFSSEANIYINHSQGLIQLLPMNCMELLHAYEWCQSCTQQLEILLQFYYITHQLRLYRVCLIQWQSCINCIHLSDTMRSADSSVFLHLSPLIFVLVQEAKKLSWHYMNKFLGFTFSHFVTISISLERFWWMTPPPLSQCMTYYHSVWCILMCIKCLLFMLRNQPTFQSL